jgi:hypothetical protein
MSTTPSSDTPCCSHCSKHAPLTCSRCKRAHYCSHECQKADYKIHRVECKKVCCSCCGKKGEVFTEGPYRMSKRMMEPSRIVCEPCIRKLARSIVSPDAVDSMLNGPLSMRIDSRPPVVAPMNCWTSAEQPEVLHRASFLIQLHHTIMIASLGKPIVMYHLHTMPHLDQAPHVPAYHSLTDLDVSGLLEEVAKIRGVLGPSSHGQYVASFDGVVGEWSVTVGSTEYTMRYYYVAADDTGPYASFRVTWMPQALTLEHVHPEGVAAMWAIIVPKGQQFPM